MARPRFASYLSLLYVAGLLALLAVLAVLQYRWTGEASLAEQERLRQGLNESLRYFERSFDREIGLAVTSYWGLPLSTVPNAADWKPSLTQLLADASRKWQASAADPRLISRILVAEIRAGTPPLLYAFTGGTPRFEQVDWPADLARLKTILQPRSRQPSGGEGIPDEKRERRRLPAHFIIDEAPALITLIVREQERTPREGPESSAHLTGATRLALIICLDRNYLFHEWVPELASRYLSTSADTGYDFAITSRQNPELILCTSRADNPGNVVALPDGKINLMRLHEEEFTVTPRGEEAGGPEVRIEGDGPRRRPRGGGGAPGGEGLVFDQRAQELAVEKLRHLQAAAEILASQGWQLSARHRAGSLDAAVATTRLRNLGISLGILLLLAITLVVLTIYFRRAQRLSKQQMEFVAGVSHELRTPIAVICSTAENLADGVVTASDQVRRYGQYILREGWRLGTLVEQTMEFAGIGSGIRRFHMQPLDLGALLGDTIGDFRPQIAEKKLEIDVSAALGAVVNADDAALGCAIGNLLSNAVKYSRPGGKIRVSLEAEPEAESLILRIADNGMGIPAGDSRHIFEPFFRGGNAVKAQIRGAGIGLSLVKSIVEAHHGTITVESRIERGAFSL